MSDLFGLRGLSWETVDPRFWVLTVDKFGLVHGHIQVPKYSSRANAWQSEGKKSFGLATVHQDDNPVSMFEVRPGLTTPPGFPQVIRPQYDGQPHSLPELVVPKPGEPAPSVTPGTIPGTHMTQTFVKRNDNTDPTVPVGKEVAPVPVAPKETAQEIPFTSSPELVYKSLLHILRVLHEMRKMAEPNWAAIDHHVDALQKLLVNTKWPISEFEG